MLKTKKIGKKSNTTLKNSIEYEKCEISAFFVQHQNYYIRYYFL